MELKHPILQILNKEHYTFAQLADYLHMTEEGLSHELSTKTLQLRNLEAIAKALRVPLYSLLRSEQTIYTLHRQPLAVNRMWTGSDEAKTVQQLQDEIGLLKEIIALKEKQIHRLSA
jgi:transcriptional regulator with XRE-family HTH domain